jgi:peptidyl-prolyl cis-trans isomerase A (cyclophilin A)
MPLTSMGDKPGYTSGVSTLMFRYLVCTLAATALFAQAVPKAAPKAASTTPGSKAPAKKAASPEEQVPLPAEPGQYAVFNTTSGRIVVRLFEKETPVTAANFAGLARGTKSFTDEKTRTVVKRPFYNGLTFHRVIPQFMIQGGDPLGNGMGGSGVPTIPDEFDPTITFDQPGRLAMANVGRPHTGSCQFFITTSGSNAAYLNGKHTIFGQVVEGQDVVDAISQVARNSDDKPDAPVVIKTLLIRRVGPPPAPPAVPAKAAKKQ